MSIRPDADLITLIFAWMDEHPSMRDAVNWYDLREIKMPEGTVVRDAKYFYCYKANVLLDGVPQCPVYLSLRFALDDYNVLTASLWGRDRSNHANQETGRAAALSLKGNGDVAAMRKLDIILNNLTGFKWKETVVRELRAPN